jgi:serine/threonine protein kinase
MNDDTHSGSAPPDVHEDEGRQTNGETSWHDSLDVGLQPTDSLRPSGYRPPVAALTSASRIPVKTHSVGDHHEGDESAEQRDYGLLKAIGHGGMGVVYAARQATLDRTVALKMLKPGRETDEMTRAQFLYEASVTGSLSHPNIVPIHDLGASGDGALFYTMKEIVGQPWSEVLGERTRAENIETLLRVCEAMAFAHDNLVIHRDLKPANVMLGSYGEVLVVDWGLAVPVDESGLMIPQPSCHAGAGTPAFMPPETARGALQEIGTWSDEYLLGAILFQIATGEFPHPGTTARECVQAASENSISAADEEDELVRLALKAMATKPSDRNGSVKHFESELRVYLSHSASVDISERAELRLTAAQLSKEYDDYSQALFGFQEALSQWSANHRAVRGISQTRLEYATCALQRRDFDLALSLVVEDSPEHVRLLQSIERAKSAMLRRQARLKLFARALVGLTVTVFCVVFVAYYMVSAERDASEDARESEELHRVAAEDAAATAQQAQSAEARQRRAAEQSARDARQSAELAARSAAEARANESFAIHEMAAARAAESEAETNLASAFRYHAERLSDGNKIAESALSAGYSLSAQETAEVRTLAVAADNFWPKVVWQGGGLHGEYLGSLTLSPTDRHLVARTQNTLTAWDLLSGRETAYCYWKRDAPEVLAIHPDGHTALTQRSNRAARWIDLKTCRYPATWPSLDHGALSAVAIAPSGNSVALANQASVEVYGLLSGRREERFEAPAPVKELQFDRDGVILGVEYGEGKQAEVMFLKTADDYEVNQLRLKDVSTWSVSRSGQFIAAGYLNGATEVLELASGKSFWKSAPVESEVAASTFLESGAAVFLIDFSTEYQDLLRLDPPDWNWRARELRLSPNKDFFPNPGSNVQMAGGSAVMVMHTDGAGLDMISLDELSLVGSQGSGVRWSENRVVVAPGGEWFAMCNHDAIRLYELGSREFIGKFPVPETQSIVCEHSADGEFLLWATDENAGAIDIAARSMTSLEILGEGQTPIALAQGSGTFGFALGYRRSSTGTEEVTFGVRRFSFTREAGVVRSRIDIDVEHRIQYLLYSPDGSLLLVAGGKKLSAFEAEWDELAPLRWAAELEESIRDKGGLTSGASFVEVLGEDCKLQSFSWDVGSAFLTFSSTACLPLERDVIFGDPSLLPGSPWFIPRFRGSLVEFWRGGFLDTKPELVASLDVGRYCSSSHADISDDGRFLVFGCPEPVILDMLRREEPIPAMEGADWSRDSKYANGMFVAEDRNGNFWTGEVLSQMQMSYDRIGSGTSVKIQDVSSDADLLVCAYGRVGIVWRDVIDDIRTGPEQEGCYGQARFSANADRVSSWYRSLPIIWNLEDDTLSDIVLVDAVDSELGPEKWKTVDMAWSPDGSGFFVILVQETARKQDRRQLILVGNELQAREVHPNGAGSHFWTYPTTITFTPGGDELILADDDFVAKFEIRDGQLLFVNEADVCLGDGNGGLGVLFDPAERWLGKRCYNSIDFLTWDLGREIAQLPVQHGSASGPTWRSGLELAELLRTGRKLLWRRHDLSALFEYPADMVERYREKAGSRIREDLSLWPRSPGDFHMRGGQ